jgi:lysozyme
MEFSLDFFEVLRRMKARREAASAETPPSCPAPDADPAAQSQPFRIGPAGLALIKRFEGCAKKRSDRCFEAYPDPGSGGEPWTIGWGATGKGIAKGTVWTQAECDARLEADLIRFAREVARTIGDAPTSQGQFDALVSFHYNTGAIGKATLTRLHKAGRHAEAAGEFGKWVHAGGKRLSGLVRRRAAEAALYGRG